MKRILVLVFMVLLSTIILTGCGDEKKAAEVKPTTTEQTKQKPKTNYNGGLQEMMESFNIVESKHNEYGSIYAGLTFQNPNTLIIYVNDRWNYISKDTQLGFIKQVGMLWGGMTGARKLEFTYDDFNIIVRHKQSDRTVATWDSLWGPSIK